MTPFQARFWWIHSLTLVSEVNMSLTASSLAELLQKPIWTCQRNSMWCCDIVYALAIFEMFRIHSFIKYTFLNVKACCSLSHRHDIWELLKKKQAWPVCLANPKPNPNPSRTCKISSFLVALWSVALLISLYSPVVSGTQHQDSA